MGGSESKPIPSPLRRKSSNGFGSTEDQMGQKPIQVTTNVIYPSVERHTATTSTRARSSMPIHNSFNNIRIGDTSAGVQSRIYRNGELATPAASSVTTHEALPSNPVVYLRSSPVILEKSDEVKETKFCNGLFTRDRVVWLSDTGGVWRGTVVWLGRIRGEDVAGLEFDEALHMGSGWLQGREYYKCAPNRGAWISVAALMKERDFDGKRNSEEQLILAGMSSTRISSRPDASTIASTGKPSSKATAFGASSRASVASTATSSQGSTVRSNSNHTTSSTSNLVSSRTWQSASSAQTGSGTSSIIHARHSTLTPSQTVTATSAATKTTPSSISLQQDASLPSNYFGLVGSTTASRHFSSQSKDKAHVHNESKNTAVSSLDQSNSRISSTATSRAESANKLSSVTSAEAEESSNRSKPSKNKKKKKPPVDLAKMHDQLQNYRPTASHTEPTDLFDPFSSAPHLPQERSDTGNASSRPFYDNFGSDLYHSRSSVNEVNHNAKPKSNSSRSLTGASGDNGINPNMASWSSSTQQQDVYEPLSRLGPSGNSNYDRQQHGEYPFTLSQFPDSEDAPIDVYVPLNPRGGLSGHRGGRAGNKNNDNRGRGKRGNHRSRGQFRGNNNFQRNNSRESDNGNKQPQPAERSDGVECQQRESGEVRGAFFNPGFSESAEGSSGAQNQNRSEYRQDVRNFRGHNHNQNQQRGRGYRGNGHQRSNRGRGNDKRGRGNQNHNQGHKSHTEGASTSKENKPKQVGKSGDCVNGSDRTESSGKSHECPVCMEDLTRPVYQCINGHFFCEPCVCKLTECPMCRVVMSQRIRCLAMDNVLAGDL